MALLGIGFILFGRYPAMMFSKDPQVVELTTRCLFITGFIQSGFASALIFSGALRGAGDTLVVMILSAASMFGLRFLGVLVVVHVLHRGLTAVWIVLASELFIRGLLIFVRFRHGGWKRIAV